MFRYRRYRVFLVFAVVTVFALYKFGRSSTTWREAASTAAELKNEAEDALGFGSRPRPALAHDTKKLELHIPAASSSQPTQTPPAVKKFSPPAPSRPAPTLHPKPSLQKPSIPTIRPQPHRMPLVDDPLTSSVPPIHWTKLPEKFPVPLQSLIHLPKGKSKPIPKIQAKFAPEDENAKANRIAKLDKIRAVFEKSWAGYKEYAWEHDELKPQWGGFKDPFANWRATLVDALDTLWIMGLKTEFEEAAKAVDEIDFTTTPRADIPLFETTIRYLGGLLAAYDVSGAKYKNLLDKAVELAEVLISAFDTPNRMPLTYYYWRPQFASQRHRASTRVVLAEIGSLSMEFTRLAQLTGEHKYYDAIARITDHLEEFQNNTRLPGMWPTYLDASGCGKVYVDPVLQMPLEIPDEPTPTPLVPMAPLAPLAPGDERLSPEGNKYFPLPKPDPVVLTPNAPASVPAPKNDLDQPTANEPQHGDIRDWGGKPLQRRQLDTDPGTLNDAVPEAEGPRPVKIDSAPAPTPTPPDCAPQGFMSTSEYGREEYNLGGMSDSTYEYLPKQYLLLGGQVAKYRKMFEDSMDVIKKHLLFRPMLPKGDDILFSGKLNVPSVDDTKKVGDLDGENTHLTCFAGGMFGMGAKLFDRPEDLEIAKKLTEGCIWSYSMTQSGIMPESFEVVPCEEASQCSWNETLYWETLDPRSDYRLNSYKDQMELYHSQMASAQSWYEEQLVEMTASPTPVAIPTEAPFKLDKRQLVDMVDEPEPTAALATAYPTHLPEPVADAVNNIPTRTLPEADDDLFSSPSRILPVFPYVYSPSVPMNHKDFVQNRVQEERLPQGVTKIGSRSYILRPEAIESVWYMYRITGDNHWREAGWRMFLAIEKHTSTKFGNSAIDDVTKFVPTIEDSMESFWLAETLKYFYLLFATEDVVSLDEWVLNTEAHPFKRPT